MTSKNVQNLAPYVFMKLNAPSLISMDVCVGRYVHSLYNINSRLALGKWLFI